METQRKMNAVVIGEYGGPEVLRFVCDMNVPIPGENQVLVNMKAVGINSADSRIREGTFMPHAFKPNAALGLDGAGVIELVGDGVTKFKPGDRVYVVQAKTGTYAQYSLVKESHVYPLHDKLCFKEGAVLGVPYFTAYRALVQRGKFKKGDNVLIQGASGQVGLASINLAHGLGAGFIIGTAGTNEGRNVALKNGADVVLDYKAEDFKDRLKKVILDKEIDVIIETNCDVNIDLDLDVIGSGGRIVIVGKKGMAMCNPAKLMAKEAIMMGSALSVSNEEERAMMAKFLHEVVEEGWLRPYINKEYSLRQAKMAHSDMQTSKGACGKSILVL